MSWFNSITDSDERMRWFDSITDSMDMNLNKLQEIGRAEKSDVFQSVEFQRVGHDLATEQQENKMR